MPISPSKSRDLADENNFFLTSLKLNLFSFFICGCQHHQRKTICLYVYISDIRKIVGYRAPVFIQRFPWRLHITIPVNANDLDRIVLKYGCFESCQLRPRSVFFLSWRLNKSAGDFRCLRYYCDTSVLTGFISTTIRSGQSVLTGFSLTTIRSRPSVLTGFISTTIRSGPSADQ
jgi:hypothetical protein